ncbi:hypothetical protein [Streptomyces virginiae]|uniref:hypothetical protein n=1 Tax=Streptomyces virginiae TaxID=1961 RepID=UPI0036F641EF
MKSRLLSTATIGALALVPVIGLATPAAAVSHVYECTTGQEKEFATSGWNTVVNIRVCAEEDDATGAIRATASMSWKNGGGNKFNNFDLHLRTEKYDVTVKGAVCDFTSRLNSVEAGVVQCQVPWTHGVTPGGITGDATVFSDVKDDGAAEAQWDLGGSPVLVQ